MSFASSVLLGMATGMVFILGYRFFQQRRSRARVQRAINVAMLSCIGREDLMKLIPGEVFPNWAQFPEFERVNWLNKQLKEIWPYVNKAASAMIKEIVEPILEEYRPVVLLSMNFSKLTLGSIAPQIGGIKVVEDGNHEEILLEVDFKWGGDPSIILSIVTLVGVPLKVQVKDLQFWGVFRIALTPLEPKIPPFGALVVALKEKPTVNFTLKVAGGDISKIPKLAETLESVIKTAISDSLLWPVRIVIPIQDGDYKHLEMQNVGVVEVKVVEGRQLPNLELVGTIDPYATVFVRPIPSLTKQTRTMPNTTSPRWNEPFTFDVQDLAFQKITVQVWDADDLLGATAVGEAALPLKDLVPGKLEDVWLPLVKDVDRPKLDSVDRGAVHLEILYREVGRDGKPQEFVFDTKKSDVRAVPGMTLRQRQKETSEDAVLAQYERGVLAVTVVGANDLVSKDLNGFSDPFVVLKMQVSGAKKRTQVMPKTLNPVWNETFDFLVEDGKREMILAEVWDHDLFGRKEFLGRVGVTLTKVMMEGEYSVDYQLADISQGTLALKFKWTAL